MMKLFFFPLALFFKKSDLSTDKLWLKRCSAFNSSVGCVRAVNLSSVVSIRSSLELTTWPKQVGGSVLLELAMDKRAFLLLVRVAPFD